MNVNYLHNSPLNNRTFSNLLCHSTPFVSIGQEVELHDLFMFPLFIFPRESVPTTIVPSVSWLTLGFSSRISMSSLLKYLYCFPSMTSNSTPLTNAKRPLRYFPPFLKRTAEPDIIQPKKTRTQNVRRDNNTNIYCIKTEVILKLNFEQFLEERIYLIHYATINANHCDFRRKDVLIFYISVMKPFHFNLWMLI